MAGVEARERPAAGGLWYCFGKRRGVQLRRACPRLAPLRPPWRAATAVASAEATTHGGRNRRGPARRAHSLPPPPRLHPSAPQRQPQPIPPRPLRRAPSTLGQDAAAGAAGRGGGVRHGRRATAAARGNVGEGVGEGTGRRRRHVAVAVAAATDAVATGVPARGVRQGWRYRCAGLPRTRPSGDGSIPGRPRRGAIQQSPSRAPCLPPSSHSHPHLPPSPPDPPQPARRLTCLPAPPAPPPPPPAAACLATCSTIHGGGRHPTVPQIHPRRRKKIICPKMQQRTTAQKSG